MKKVQTSIWDPAEYLTTNDEIIAYLDDAFSTGDSQLIIAAIGDVARACGMSKIAEDVKCSRESLYKSLSQSGNPSFDTIVKVLLSLGFCLKPSNANVS